jgi:16S rRNA (uracil1498-N3)-methyltransferase
VNLVLFEQGELDAPLAPDDPRARHVRETLKRTTGGSFDCGVVDGPRGRATIDADTPEGMRLVFTWSKEPPPLPPLWLIIGLPRPQTVRKVLREVTALGVARIMFFTSERSESSYAASSVWRSEEIRRHLKNGAAQAFCTRLPEVCQVDSLEAAVELTTAAAHKFALDIYEAGAPLAEFDAGGVPVVLAVGSERGWTGRERALLRATEYTLVHLGPRVLRTETASVAGLTLLRAKMGLLG